MQVHWFDVDTGVGAEALATIVGALNLQTVHITAAWGRAAALEHVAGEDPALVPKTATKAYLLPNLDVADALGYHDVDPLGDPYVRVGVDVIRDHVAGDWVLGSVDGVSAVCSHEACELAVDPSANSWVPTGGSRQVALETADPVQGFGYNVTFRWKRVALSDFVYPRWFGIGAPVAAFDACAKLSRSFQLGVGGYAIVKDGAGNESQVFGAAFPDWKLGGGEWPASRTFKRLHTE